MLRSGLAVALRLGSQTAPERLLARRHARGCPRLRASEQRRGASERADVDTSSHSGEQLLERQLRLRRAAARRAEEEAPRWLAALLGELAGEAALAEYLAMRHHKVHGYFELGMAAVLASVMRLQRDLGVRGSVAEVGVLAGASFFPLLLLTQPGEAALAMDCFAEDQGANVDGSGYSAAVPSAAEFSRLLERSVPQDNLRQRAIILQCNSATVSPAELQSLLPADTCGVRVFSIDGCHTAEATASDCALAAAMTAPGGVLMLDDVFNPHWPGVSSGLMRFLQEHPSGFKPFFIGFNKVLLCRAEDHPQFLAHAAALPSHCKLAAYMGAQVSVHRQGWLTAMYGND